MNKRCEDCGRFMKLGDRMPYDDDDDFDEELARECGLTEDQLDEAHGDSEGKWSRFRYVLEQWECDNCDTLEPHLEGPRYYWNPKSGWYDGQKPTTPKERAAQKREHQKAAGQLDMF